MTIILRTDTAITDPTAPVYVRDQLLANSNDGVRFLFDFGRPYSWPNQDNPHNGDGVRDISQHANAPWNISGAGPTFELAAGFMNFSTVSVDPADVVIPAAFAADIWADQLFLISMYLKVPNEDQWPASGASDKYWLCATTGNSGVMVSGELDIISLGMWTNGATKYLVARRQLSGTTVETLYLPMAGHFGTVGQFAFWRTAAQQGLRWRSSVGSVREVEAKGTGTKNVADFSGKTLQFGMPGSTWFLPAAGDQASRNYKIARVFGENLSRSGRAPLDVLDADYARNIGRFTG